MNDVLALLRDSGVIVGVTYLGKLVIERSFSRDMERFRRDLAIELERHKSELARETFAHQARFSALQARVPDALLEVFESTGEAIGAYIGAMRIGRGATEIAAELQLRLSAEHMEKARERAARCVLLFPENVIQDLHSLLNGLAEALQVLADAFDEIPPGLSRDIDERRASARDRSFAIYKEKVEKPYDRFAAISRRVLGVEALFTSGAQP